MGQTLVRGARLYEPEYWIESQAPASLNFWSAECQGLRQRQHKTEHKGHTHSSRIEIKISDPAGKLSQAAWNSTDHAAVATHYLCT